MGKIEDPVFGDLEYDGFWMKPYLLTIFGDEIELIIRIQGERDDGIEPSQRIAYEEFEANREVIIRDAEIAILDYYQEIAPSYRDMFGATDAASRLPPMEDVIGLRNVVTPRYLWFPWNFIENERRVGIVFDCSWDPGHGLAVKIVNGNVSEVGPQDIVL